MVWQFSLVKGTRGVGARGSAHSNGGDGGAFTPEIPLAGCQAWTVGAGCAPCSGRSSAERQAFYGAVVAGIGNGGRRNAFSYYPDANAPVGIGVHRKYRPPCASSSLGPYGVRHVNPAGQEFREFLQLQGLALAATFFEKCSRYRYLTRWHPESKQEYQLDHWLVNRRQLGQVMVACVRCGRHRPRSLSRPHAEAAGRAAANTCGPCGAANSNSNSN